MKRNLHMHQNFYLFTQKLFIVFIDLMRLLFCPSFAHYAQNSLAFE